MGVRLAVVAVVAVVVCLGVLPRPAEAGAKGAAYTVTDPKHGGAWQQAQVDNGVFSVRLAGHKTMRRLGVDVHRTGYLTQGDQGDVFVVQDMKHPERLYIMKCRKEFDDRAKESESVNEFNMEAEVLFKMKDTGYTAKPYAFVELDRNQCVVMEAVTTTFHDCKRDKRCSNQLANYLAAAVKELGQHGFVNRDIFHDSPDGLVFNAGLNEAMDRVILYDFGLCYATNNAQNVEDSVKSAREAVARFLRE